SPWAGTSDAANSASGWASTSLTPPFPLGLSIFDTNVRGQNFVLDWARVIDDDTDWRFQTYYDNAEKTDPVIDDGQRTFDLDFQYRFPVGQRHNVIWGAGYRHVNSRAIITSPNARYIPARRTPDPFSYFLQDEIALKEDRLYLTLGSKFEHNDFSGFEYQPSARILYLPSERQSVWAAVSRAVRTPSRSDFDQYSVYGADFGLGTWYFET